MTSPRPAVVLLSGGLDSATCLAIARDRGFAPHAISFRYGQRHDEELRRAAVIARTHDCASHRVVDIDLAAFGGSALTDTDIEVPKGDHVESVGTSIPVTYVPARNTVFLSLAVAFAETIGSLDIFIGVNALDYSGYPDCRPAYIEAFEAMANLATKSGVEGPNRLTIHAPLIDLTKAEIIRTGLRLGVDYQATLSCYDPVRSDDAPVRTDDHLHPGPADEPDASRKPSETAHWNPCGRCDACLLRARGFAENAIQDPAHQSRGDELDR